ncbi:MAG: hypothetical protein JNM27_11375 [Leptospirales bacterium]|nr:hypothetical protein [Leptospirales bacterium]
MKASAKTEPLYTVSITTEFKNKNLNKGALNYRLKPQRMTIQELLNHVLSGYPTVPMHLSDYKKPRGSANYDGSNLIMLDIDGGITIEEFLKVWRPHVLAIYTSASHQKQKGKKEPEDRFRVLIALPVVIKIPAIYCIIVAMLIDLTGADSACSDPAHAYYGNTEAIVIICSPESTLDLFRLHNMYYASVHRNAYRRRIIKLQKEYRLSIEEVNQAFSKLIAEIYSDEGLKSSTEGAAFAHLFHIEEGHRVKSAPLRVRCEDEEGPHDASDRKIQRYDFQYLFDKCCLVRALKESKHAEWIHVVRNLCLIDGGRGYFLKWIADRPYEGLVRGDEYYERAFADFSRKQLAPSYCSRDNCHYYGTSDCTNPPLNLIDQQRLKQGQVRRLERDNIERLPLVTVRPLVQKKIRGLIERGSHEE